MVLIDLLDVGLPHVLFVKNAVSVIAAHISKEMLKEKGGVMTH